MGRVVRARSAFFLTLSVVVLAACNEKPKPPVRVEAPIAAPSVQAAPQPQQPAQATRLAPATAADVRAALARVWGDAVKLDDLVAPNFITGDFNSDDSQDLLAIVQPNPERLANLNSEVANWTISDPAHEWLAPSGVGTFKLPPPDPPQKVTAGERVVVVIHGYGPQGWRDANARQAYVLREVAGSIAGTTHLEQLPRQVKAGDVVRQTLGAEKGYLYWSGAKYVWQKGAPPQPRQKLAAVSGRAAASR
jgi:hypothetical protein